MNCTTTKHGAPTIQCDGCRGNIHLACAGLTENDVKLTRAKSCSMKIVCNSCNLNMDQFSKIKNLISSLENHFTKSISELKTQFEEKLNEIKSSHVTNESKISESLIQEISERQKRASNVLIFNIEESISQQPDERMQHDKDAVKSLLDTIPSVDSNVIHVTRLGNRTSADKARPVRICFSDQQQALQVLKNKQKILSKNNKLRIRADETPMQREFMASLRAELKDKVDHGQADLTIKYVRGTPTIVKKN